MQLSIKPYHKNIYPAGGILVKGGLLSEWLSEIYLAGLTLTDISVHPIPGNMPNTIWGCLIVTGCDVKKIDIGKNSYCQLVSNQLFIPQNSIVYPRISGEGLQKLLGNTNYILHPEFGLVALNEPINWQDVITIPAEALVQIKQPVKGVTIPFNIKSFQIHTLPPENILENLEKKQFPQTKPFEDKSLNILEKVKLGLYRLLFRKQNRGSKNEDNSTQTRRVPLLNFLQKLLSPLYKRADKLVDKMQMSYEELEKRNQKQIDRLLDLFRSNPGEALQYAIPLDEDGTSRGGREGLFQFSKRWFDISLNNNSNRYSVGGNILIPNEYMAQLRHQYLETANLLVQNNEFEKAAFIYLKLLKDHAKAAQTLENGRMYAEAASIYIKYTNNKFKAAECYERGSMYTPAIDIYKELGNDEKVGDLYTIINQRDLANKYYDKVAEDHTANYQYMKAALVYKNKIKNIESAQQVLLKGWRNGRDAFNCLKGYFANIEDTKELEKEISSIYTNETTSVNKGQFLQVLKHEYEQQPAVAETAKEIAYEIISQQALISPEIVSEIKAFNKKDTVILKDILRFKTGRKKGMIS